MAVHIGGSVRRISTGLAVALCSFCSGQIGHAQQYLRTISGEVADSTGAKIGNAQVEVNQERRNFTTKKASEERRIFNTGEIETGKPKMNSFRCGNWAGIAIYGLIPPSVLDYRFHETYDVTPSLQFRSLLKAPFRVSGPGGP